MKHLFVPYSIALAVKGKGYNEPCLTNFNPAFFNEEAHTLNNYPHPLDIGYKNSEGIDFNIVAAPTYQQVVDWFRESNRTHIEIVAADDFHYQYAISQWAWNDREQKQRVTSHVIGDHFMKTTSKPYFDYYEALTEAINHAITLI